MKAREEQNSTGGCKAAPHLRHVFPLVLGEEAGRGCGDVHLPGEDGKLFLLFSDELKEVLIECLLSTGLHYVDPAFPVSGE